MFGGEKAELYQLILRQLSDDGLNKIAETLSQTTGLSSSQVVSRDHLLSLFDSSPTPDQLESFFPSSPPSISPDDPQPFPNYSTRFVSVSKSSVRCAGFSCDGIFAATAADDCSVKILEVEKMHAHADIKGEKTSEYESTKPVFRTLYDHTRPVNDITFHPSRPFLVTGSADCTVRFFDFTKQTSKKAFRLIRETMDVRSIAMHPLGDFILVGVDHPIVRLYDISTSEPYTTADSTKHHAGPITQVRYSGDGKYFASCSRDGSVKIWDGVNMSCIRTLLQTHSGESVNTVQFSACGRLMLTGGQDTVARLWDVGSGKQVLEFERSQKGNFRAVASFTFGDEFVLTADETTSSVYGWDSKSGALLGEVKGHTKYVRSLCASPVENVFISCGDDSRARFWATDPME